MKLVIVDYGAGNLRSVARAVAHAGGQPLITSSGRDVERADALIVPGVGAAADTMANLKRHNMVAPIREYIASGRAFLGVCMGQQALVAVLRKRRPQPPPPPSAPPAPPPAGAPPSVSPSPAGAPSAGCAGASRRCSPPSSLTSNSA